MRLLPELSHRRLGLFLAAATFVLVSACEAEGAAVAAMQSTDLAVASDAKMTGFAAEASLGRGVAGGRALAAESPPPGPQAQGTVDSAISSMLIRTGHVTIRVDSLESAMARLQQLAASLGGTVGNVTINAGDFTVRSATLELRIPSARFDAAMRGVQPIGKIESSTVSAQDVGEEYVDVRARTQNARRLESRLIDLLATRTGKLEDVLAVERELARVREEIERNEGRMRWLGARVATSTINVTVHEPAPILGEQPGQSMIGKAFVRAWQNFVGLVASTIASLGVLLPIGLVVWGVARLWRARGRRPSVEG